jgi:hypothetical protein
MMIQLGASTWLVHNLEKPCPGAVWIWHDKSAGGIEHTNPGENIRQILAEQSCEFTQAALIFSRDIEKGRFEGSVLTAAKF